MERTADFFASIALSVTDWREMVPVQPAFSRTPIRAIFVTASINGNRPREPPNRPARIFADC